MDDREGCVYIAFDEWIASNIIADTFHSYLLEY